MGVPVTAPSPTRRVPSRPTTSGTSPPPDGVGPAGRDRIVQRPDRRRQHRADGHHQRAVGRAAECPQLATVCRGRSRSPTEGRDSTARGQHDLVLGATSTRTRSPRRPAARARSPSRSTASTTRRRTSSRSSTPCATPTPRGRSSTSQNKTSAPDYRQAEHFTTFSSGISTYTKTAAEGGRTVGDINNGDWISFTPAKVTTRHLGADPGLVGGRRRHRAGAHRLVNRHRHRLRDDSGHRLVGYVRRRSPCRSPTPQWHHVAVPDVHRLRHRLPVRPGPVSRSAPAPRRPAWAR